MRQSAIEFPLRNVEDWYTLTNNIGQGGFGQATLAYDDRGRLLHLLHGRTIDIPTHSDYNLISDPPEASKLRNMEPFESINYLAKFTRNAILQVYPASKDELRNLSRYDLLLRLVVGTSGHTIPWDETRDIVVIKLVGPEYSLRHAYAAGDLNKQAQNTAKTEVYSLSRVSSMTEVYIRVDANVNVHGDPVLDIEAIPPVGCMKLIDVVSPLVCLLDYFQFRKETGNDGFAIVLTHTNGENIQQLMDNCNEKLNISSFPKPFPALFVWYTAWTMLHALEYIHGVGIIHNDVKTENIVWDPKKGEITLIDFGLSCHATLGEGPPGTKDFCDSRGGTPDYAASELATPPFYRFPVSDIWALGIVLWELATGRNYNVPGDDPRTKLQNVRDGARPDILTIPMYNMWKYEDLMELLDNMLQPDPLDRWTATEALEHLQTVFESFSGPDKDDDEIGIWLFQRVTLPACYNNIISTTTLSGTGESKKQKRK